MYSPLGQDVPTTFEMPTTFNLNIRKFCLSLLTKPLVIMANEKYTYVGLIVSYLEVFTLIVNEAALSLF